MLSSRNCFSMAVDVAIDEALSKGVLTDDPLVGVVCCFCHLTTFSIDPRSVLHSTPSPVNQKIMHYGCNGLSAWITISKMI